MFPYKKVLLKICGSIAAYKVCSLISRLVQEGIEVKVVATPSALKFVGRATFEALSRHPVLTDPFNGDMTMEHIHLDRWADVVIVCPATANTINQMAHGIGDDLVKTLFLAHDFSKPYYVIPAMNAKMWTHPITQKSVEVLKSMGVSILGPASGSLACGEWGEGRMLEIDEIYQTIFCPKTLARKKILITAGGTIEPIDSVRSIVNISTGATAATIANQLITNGCEITYLAAEKAQTPMGFCQIKYFRTYNDLKDLLCEELHQNAYDYIIHAAAVSDFSVVNGSQNKIESTTGITLELKPNPKLIKFLKEFSINKNVKLIGFKLTDTDDEKVVKLAVKQLFDSAPVDYVVHNALCAKSETEHRGTIFNRYSPMGHFLNKTQLAHNISQIITGETL